MSSEIISLIFMNLNDLQMVDIPWNQTKPNQTKQKIYIKCAKETDRGKYRFSQRILRILM